MSYGRTARLERDSLLAVVPIGYGDGYPRSLSNRMTMKIRGAECPIVGRVCMDMCMVDVTGVPGVQAGDTRRGVRRPPAGAGRPAGGHHPL